MAAQVRELKDRERSVRKTQKITKAQELIATSRIGKAQAAVRASKPYSNLMTSVLSALAAASTLDHPLLNERPEPKRAGILLITSDRGLCGGYNSNAIKTAEELAALLRSEGKTPVLYIIGRKGYGFYTFRERPVAAHWQGFSERPTFADAERAARTVLEAFVAGSDGTTESGEAGVDEIHVVSTQFKSMISQVPHASRMAPLVVEYVEELSDDSGAPSGPTPSYEFEPAPTDLLDEMLPRYVNSRIYAALLDSAASESAARRQACKSATDNANAIIKRLNREANQARQAQITQELSEIVGGVDALAASGKEE
jgi:F-type H+-transporting ATPase subunit gamma